MTDDVSLPEELFNILLQDLCTLLYKRGYIGNCLPHRDLISKTLSQWPAVCLSRTRGRSFKRTYFLAQKCHLFGADRV